MCITLNGPNDRYVNDAKSSRLSVGRGNASVLGRRLSGCPWNIFITRAGKQVFSTLLLGWGTANAEGRNPSRAQMATCNPERGLGAANRKYYSEVNAMINYALATSDDWIR